MSDMHQTYLETLQTLFHTLQLYGYEFKKTLLIPSKIKSMFKKTIIYEEDDENSDYFGDMVTSDISVNVELDTNEFSENVNEDINLERSGPNVDVPPLISNKTYDDTK